MRRPLLTIALPTRDRAAIIDRQLVCLRGAIHNLADRCEILVSDDASRDDTWDMLEQWRQVMDPHLRTRRNACPIGEAGNAAACFREARGRFVWLVADDEIVDESIPSRLVQIIEDSPHLAAISLKQGFTIRDGSGHMGHWNHDETVAGPEFAMAAIREHCMDLEFMTAQVFRTEAAQAAVAAWPTGTKNRDYLLYITAYVAQCGPVHLLAESMCTRVPAHIERETDPWIGMSMAADPAEVMVHLVQLGYPRALCAAIALRQLRHFNRLFWRHAVRTPAAVPAVLWHFASSLVRVHTVPPSIPCAMSPTARHLP